MISKEHKLPMYRQCQLLEISRTGIYYRPVGIRDYDLVLMRLIDEIHLKWPFYGSRNIRDELNDLGYPVGRDHTRTLMRKMGIQAHYRRPKTSKPAPGHKIYPYLLRNLEVKEANQVWAADITYLPMAKGFCYLVAIMDLFSRRVLSWRLSNTLDVSFCLEALEEALEIYGAARDLQLRSGQPVYQRCLYRIADRLRCENQHGRQRTLDRQRLH